MTRQFPIRSALLLTVFALTPLAFAGPPAANLSDGLVAHWTFDDVKAAAVPDASGNANDAQVISATLVGGISDTALQFDGEASSVICRGGGIWSDASGLTLSAWAKPTTARFGGYPTIVRRDGAYALRFSEDHIGFLIWGDGDVVRMASHKTNWQPDRWYHLAATYDGSQMRLFIDGAEDGASPMEHTDRVNLSLVGAYVGSLRGQHAFKGTIDEVRIYSRVLSPQEISNLHDAGRETLRAQRNVRFEPKPVGHRREVFRKPKREITMVEDGYIWIDAEDFADYGGWQLDTQFVYLMGSAYLIANGVGEPVDDATVTVHIPQAGNYRLWVRAKNWYKPHAPGRFRVSVDGSLTEHVFGKADTEDWIWEAGGDFQLESGDAEIALRDLTGYYGRCDALILTTDRDYVPPDGKDAVCQERARLTDLSLEEHDGGEFDVIVVGAGSGGFPAALIAARMGAKTAIIQDRPVLGGNASTELGVPFSGASCCHPNARESGVVEELIRMKARYGYPKMSGPFRQAADDEPNLSVFCNQRVIDVRMESENHIAAVVAKHSLENTMTIYRGKLFIDGTGDGWVGYYAGADLRCGREAQSEYNESLAPEQADGITMSGCLMGGRGLAYRAVDTGRPVEYTPPPWAAKLPPADRFGRDPRHVASGNWWLEHEGTIDDLWDAEKARDELLRITYGYWDFIKNESSYQDQARTYELAETFIGNAKRESRRIIGDYVLTQNDCQSARMFEDRVSYGGWPLDVHHPEGIYSDGEGPFHCNPHVPIYSIPYRCVYSKNIDNLMMSGRDVSVSHIALGSVRVEATLAALAQAVGTAAAMAIRYDTTPRGIYQNHITELQQTLLKHDQYIPQLKNQDPDDLARRANVVASSTATYERFTKDDVEKAGQHQFTTDRAMMFPVADDEKLRTVGVLLRSQRDEPVQTTLHLREAPEIADFSSTEDLAVATASIPPGETSWIEFEVNADIDTPYAYVWLPAAEGIHWYLMAGAPRGCCRAYGSGDRATWTPRQGEYYAVYTEPAIATDTDYRPENVINGVARIVGSDSNMWASDPAEPMPQWIELQFDRPHSINEVCLTFDTNLDPRPRNVAMVPQCVRDYELSYFDAGAWHPILAEKGNFLRHRIHNFDPITTDRLRLTINATNGSKTARVFEIRAYAK